MSQQITTAFVKQFQSNVRLKLQQSGSRLRRAVLESSIQGEEAFREQVGSVKATKSTARHEDTPLTDTPHARRVIIPENYSHADLIDSADRARSLADFDSPYVRVFSNAFGRAMDESLFDAGLGTAYTGKKGDVAVELPSSQKIAVDYAYGGGGSDSGMTVEKMRQAKKILTANEAGDPDDRLYIALTAQAIDDLFAQTPVTSIDYNRVRALVDGELDYFLGFNVIRTELVPKGASSTRRVMAWNERMIELGIAIEPHSIIGPRADKKYSTQVYMEGDWGATRLEEEGVVEIAIKE